MRPSNSQNKQFKWSVNEEKQGNLRNGNETNNSSPIRLANCSIINNRH